MSVWYPAQLNRRQAGAIPCEKCSLGKVTLQLMLGERPENAGKQVTRTARADWFFHSQQLVRFEFTSASLCCMNIFPNPFSSARWVWLVKGSPQTILYRLWRSSYLRSTEDFFPDALYLALATLYSLIGATINWDLLEFRKDKRLFITQ